VLSGDERNSTIGSAVLTQYWTVTDRHLTTANTALIQQ